VYTITADRLEKSQTDTDTRTVTYIFTFIFIYLSQTAGRQTGKHRNRENTDR